MKTVSLMMKMKIWVKNREKLTLKKNNYKENQDKYKNQEFVQKIKKDTKINIILKTSK